ncbi:homeobox-leucine zipper protein ROC7-like [Daucus carota subsp. sativus]|uniref:homeobox-leucine zipper protein ROC7-like n=1 Tax=Daucus carota subsp. sativus TaxID=79200 RepID=UPI0007EFEF60|nr:PREDICTED: homeobox-leucine zipper protein ROC7-like [Daucus carota subsp. sativus]
MSGIYQATSDMGSAANGAIMNQNSQSPGEESAQPPLKRMRETGSSSGPNKKDSKKSSRRHSFHQKRAMESFFQIRQHPGHEERRRLSHDLGLEPSQVKFWFQNKRTQMKVLQDKNDSGSLESENQRLTELKNKMLAALRNIECIRCSGDLKKVDSETHQLQLENARLRAEHEKVSAIASSMRENPDF